MPKFDVDVQGVTYEVDAPNEKTAWLWANQTHVQSQVLPTESKFEDIPKPLTYPEQLKQELADNPIGASYASAGTALTDLYQGGKQLLGMGDKQAMQEQQIIREQSPMSALAGNVALYGALGTAFPAANTAKGAGMTGAGVGLLQPTNDPNVVKGKLQNALIGGTLGYVGGKTSGMIADKGAKARQMADILRQQNIGRDTLQKEVVGAGYALPPSYAQSGVMPRLLEGISGKYKTGQAAQIKNQQVTNQLARDYLGLPESASLSEEGLAALRQQLASPYEEVSKLQALSNPMAGAGVSSPVTKTGKEALEELKQVRFDSKQNWNFFNRSGDPEAYQKAIALDKAASGLENQIDMMAQQSGNKELLNQLRTARKDIAKTFTIENAMQGSNVSAKNIAKALERGAPLTDEMKTVAKFAQQYPDIARVPASGDANPFTVLDLYGALGAGAGSAVLGGSPLVAGAIPVARIGAREAILSKTAQKLMANKNYGTGPTRKLAEALLASRQSPMAIAGGTIPALSE